MKARSSWSRDSTHTMRLVGGFIVTMPSPSTICIKMGDVTVEDGIIRSIEYDDGEDVSRRSFVECVATAAAVAALPASSAATPEEDVVDCRGRFLLPGFVDCHAHAPQYAFTGSCIDLPLLEWLETYTFPTERRFEDVEYARGVYMRCVARHVLNGTTTCSYFGTIHLESSKLLVDVVRRYGQRAWVGKVNMDRNSPDDYCESTAASLADTAAFVEWVRDSAAATPPLVAAAITPRFVPTCTAELMRGLAALADEHGLHVQSHLSESAAECEWVKALHPEASCYLDVYDRAGLLGRGRFRTYMAHCVQSDAFERAMLRETSTAVVHCAASNFNIGSGVCNVRRLLREGVDVCLGTDVAGGCSPSMLDAIQQTVVASKVAMFGARGDFDPAVEAPDAAAAAANAPLTLVEALYLATVGGAKVLGLEGVTGQLAVGLEFDCNVVDVRPPSDPTERSAGPVDVFEHDVVEDVLSKFLLLGDERALERIYVRGRLVAREGKLVPGA